MHMYKVTTEEKYHYFAFNLSTEDQFNLPINLYKLALLLIKMHQGKILVKCK